MPEISDMVLIREYADRGSEPAFAELVQRHIHLVHSVAFRYVGNYTDAQDITQAVFIILAKKAGGLRQRTTLTGWLYETTRLTAARLRRTRGRQQTREQEAHMQSTLNEPGHSEVWRQLAPTLEEAMDRLNEKERTMLALRFFDNKSAAESAMLLGIRQEAAQKRATRGLEKLRRFFLNRGIDSTTTAIAGAISANFIQAAPAALAKSVTVSALAKGAAAGGSTLTLVKGALKVMAWTKMKTAVVAGAVALLATVTTTTVILHRSPASRRAANLALAKTGIPIDPQAVAQAAVTSKILLFRDIPSWNRNPDFEDALTALHFKFDAKPSSEMANTDLSSYDLVIIPGAQWHTRFYGHYAENASRFDSYVSNGGTLLLELNGAEHDGITLPGGVRMVAHGAVDNELLLPQHPILLPLGGRPIHANLASHGYLEGVPNNAIVLATEMVKGKALMNRPTFIEYPYGSGRVLAACQCFHDRDGSGRGPLMQSSIGYAAVKQWFSPGLTR